MKLVRGIVREDKVHGAHAMASGGLTNAPDCRSTREPTSTTVPAGDVIVSVRRGATQLGY
jgi:hypothetical protein